MNATQLGTLAATGAVIAHRHVACGTNVARAWFSGTLAESLNAILYAFAVTECDSSLQPVAITQMYDDAPGGLRIADLGWNISADGRGATRWRPTSQLLLTPEQPTSERLGAGNVLLRPGDKSQVGMCAAC